MTIHKEGKKTLTLLSFCLLIVNIMFQFILPRNNDLHFGILLGSFVLICFIVYFFRIPNLLLLLDDKVVLAPADGRIVVIEQVLENEYFKDRRLQVSIFMSPTNVHVNRNPVSGIVKYLKYHSGNYLVAWHPKSSTDNERFTTVIEKDDVVILVRQIAGKVARKIRNYLNEGDSVTQGAELGFIKFGSRVDIFLPIGTPLNVTLNH